MIYVIIPIYISSERLVPIVRKCIKSYTEQDSKLILVDDSSPIKMTLEADVVLSTPLNLGYTGAVNTGLKHVLETATNEDIVFVINDDVEFPSNWYEIKEILTNDVGVVSPLVSDEPPQPRGRIIEGMKFGSFWASKVKTFRKLGLLDENMSSFFSDTDFYKRVKDAKLRVIKDTSVYVQHAGNQTYGELDSEEIYAKDALVYKSKHGRID